jgi:hypothetical protein
LLDIEYIFNSIKELIIQLFSNPLYSENLAKIASLLFPVIIKDIIDAQLISNLLGAFLSNDSLLNKMVHFRSDELMSMCRTSIENGNLFSGSLSYNYALISYCASILFHDNFLRDFRNIWSGLGTYLKGVLLPYLELFKINKKSDKLREPNYDLFTSIFDLIVDIFKHESTEEFIEAIVQTLMVDIGDPSTLLNINNFFMVIRGKEYIYSEIYEIIVEDIDRYIEILCSAIFSSRNCESIGIIFLKSILNIQEETPEFLKKNYKKDLKYERVSKIDDEANEIVYKNIKILINNIIKLGIVDINFVLGRIQKLSCYCNSSQAVVEKLNKLCDEIIFENEICENPEIKEVLEYKSFDKEIHYGCKGLELLWDFGKIAEPKIELMWDIEKIKKIEQARLEEQAKLEQARLEEQAKLEQAKLEQAKLEQAKLEQAKLEQAKIEQAKLEQAKLEQAKIEQAKIEQAKLEQAKLEQAKLEQAKLEQAKIEQSRLEEQVRLEEQARLEEQYRLDNIERQKYIYMQRLNNTNKHVSPFFSGKLFGK